MHYEIEPALGRKRKERSRNLFPEERVSIGVEAHFATGEAVARKYGLGVGTVYGIKKGFVQTAGNEIGKKDSALVEAIEQGVEEARKKVVSTAGRILLDAMNGITVEKLAKARVRELSGVARDMAGVIEKVEGRGNNGNGGNNGSGAGGTIIVYSPRVMVEHEMGPVIEVSAERR
jgi:hypothetical protein